MERMTNFRNVTVIKMVTALKRGGGVYGLGGEAGGKETTGEA